MSLLDALQTKAQQLSDELSTTKNQIREEQLRIIKIDFKIDIDTIVMYNNNRYKISYIRPDSYLKPWVRGYLLKKDGSWSRKEHYLYNDWSLLNE
jgi:hypothetical protein